MKEKLYTWTDPNGKVHSFPAAWLTAPLPPKGSDEALMRAANAVLELSTAHNRQVVEAA